VSAEALSVVVSELGESATTSAAESANASSAAVSFEPLSSTATSRDAASTHAGPSLSDRQTVRSRWQPVTRNRTASAGEILMSFKSTTRAFQLRLQGRWMMPSLKYVDPLV